MTDRQRILNALQNRPVNPRTCAFCQTMMDARPNEHPSHFAKRRFCSISCRAAGRNGTSYDIGPEYEVLHTGYRAEDGPSACWLWLRCTNPAGYGEVTRHRVAQLAHRLFYERDCGPIPAGLQIDHLCFQTRCVNPLHLEAVTPLVNTRRSRKIKLTLEGARLIKAAEVGTVANVARRLGVAVETAYAVRQGRTWRDA